MAIIHRMVDSWYRVEDVIHDQDLRKKPQGTYRPNKSQDYIPLEPTVIEKYRESLKKEAKDLVLSHIETLKKEITAKSSESSIDTEKNILQFEGELNYFLNNNIDDMVEEICYLWAKDVIVFFEDKDNRKLYVGAQGELKVAEELMKLSDAYYVINNFFYEFKSPIYQKDIEGPIYKIQVDHIVVGPTGIFVIETKNWSRNSVDHPDSCSPKNQINKYGYALWYLINNRVLSLPSFKHWVKQKVPVKNIVCWTNKKPNRVYEHIVMCTSAELRQKIERHHPVFNNDQI